MKKRKIAVVTGSRAEYGLLFWLLNEIQNDSELELQLIVTGMHLADEFGLTYKQIVQDGFRIADKIHILSDSDSPYAMAKSVGLGIMKFADCLEKLQPDILVVLGDRFEILAAAQTAVLSGIPVAHIHGGEITMGAVDDAIRHALTKLSHIHFPVAQSYYNRILQMGEDSTRVYNFGCPGLDHLDKTSLLSKEVLQDHLDFALGKRNFLITYHPVTLLDDAGISGLRALLQVLDEFQDATLIFTKANADAGGRHINAIIDEYVAGNTARAKIFPSLGLQRYMSVAKYSDVVIGNSSSGLIEIPHLGVPTVNIGMREKGRLLASSVINCDDDVQGIRHAIQLALSNEFRATLGQVVTPYEKGNASQKIKNVLKTVQLNGLLVKRFNDLGGVCG